MKMGKPESEKINRIESALKERYGSREWRQHRPPVDELVLTILSQHTSDLNSERAFASLIARFSTWESILAASLSDIAAAIRSGGLAEQKAPRIQAVLRSILHERGAFDLEFLASVPVPNAREWLTNLPGVGPKTASCVLLFSFGRPAFPVDTHVHRVAQRLGLVEPSTTPEKTQLILESLLGEDRDRIYALHMNFIAHGRAVCVARRPRCGECPVTRCCDYYNQLAADTQQSASSLER
jgi:endonuclease-3